MFFFFYGLGILLYTSYVLVLHLSAHCLNIQYLSKKKKKKKGKNNTNASSTSIPCHNFLYLPSLLSRLGATMLTKDHKVQKTKVQLHVFLTIFLF
jgi:hypothetical protein